MGSAGVIKVEIALDKDGLITGLNLASASVADFGQKLKANLAGGMNDAAGGTDSLFAKMKELKVEAVGHQKVFNFYGAQLAGLAGVAKGTAAEFVGLAASLASGMWVGAAIAGAKLLVDHFHEANLEAERLKEVRVKFTVEGEKELYNAITEATVAKMQHEGKSAVEIERYKASRKEEEAGVELAKERTDLENKIKSIREGYDRALTNANAATRKNLEDLRDRELKPFREELEKINATFEKRESTQRKTAEIKGGQEDRDKEKKMAEEHERAMAAILARGLEGRRRIEGEYASAVAAIHKQVEEHNKTQGQADQEIAALRTVKSRELALFDETEKKKNRSLMDAELMREKAEHDAERVRAHDADEVAKEEILQEEQSSLKKISLQQELTKARKKTGEESAAETRKDAIAEENQIYAIKRDALVRQLALENLSNKERARIRGQLVVEEQQHAVNLARIDQTAFQSQVASAKRTGQQIGTAFGTMFKGLLSGTESTSKAIGSLLQSMADMAIDAVVDMATKSIMANAANAASGAAASQAGIPIVGPVLAAGAMVAVGAMVKGLIGSISAEGGADIGNSGGLMFYHPKEMMLPQKYGNVIRKLADQPDTGSGGGASSGGGSGGGEVHNHWNVSSPDAKGVERLFRENRTVFQRQADRIHRNGRRKR